MRIFSFCKRNSCTQPRTHSCEKPPECVHVVAYYSNRSSILEKRVLSSLRAPAPPPFPPSARQPRLTVHCLLRWSAPLFHWLGPARAYPVRTDFPGSACFPLRPPSHPRGRCRPCAGRRLVLQARAWVEQ